jgi:hypothetical protein
MKRIDFIKYYNTFGSIHLRFASTIITMQFMYATGFAAHLESVRVKVE